MKQTLSTIAFLALSGSLLPAAAPTPEAMTAALAAARVEWQYNVTEPIEIRWEALNACDLRPGAQAADVATTQVLDTQTTMRFDDGSPATDEDGTPMPITHSYTYVIRFNSACDWSKINLQAIMTHEYGHVLLGGAYHSKDRCSIMYWKVGGAQSVTAADRQRLADAVKSTL